MTEMPTRFLVEQRTDYQNAKPFGQAGPYEFIVARAVTDNGEGRLEYLKPREPSKGDGAMLFMADKSLASVVGEDPALLEAGYIIASLTWPDAKTRLAGIQDVMNFLRVTGGPMLLGDQRTFVKRAIALDNGSWIGQFVSAGHNAGLKGKKLFDGAWLIRAEAKPIGDLKVLYSDAKGADPKNPNVRLAEKSSNRKGNVALLTSLDAWIKEGS